MRLSSFIKLETLNACTELESRPIVIQPLVIRYEAYVLEVVRPEAECAKPGRPAVIIMPRVFHHEAQIQRPGKIHRQLDLGNIADVDREQ